MFLSQVKVSMGVLLLAVTLVSGAGVLVSHASGPTRQEKKSEAGSPNAQHKEVVSPNEAQGEKVTAETIGNAYQTNAALADERFTGQRVTVTGKMLRIRGARLGQFIGSTGPGARIYYLEMTVPSGPHPPLLLRFQFTKDSRNQLAKLKVGQQVSVEGEPLEPAEGSGGTVTLIEFRNCTIIEGKEGS
jgi:hypothetical protein